MILKLEKLLFRCNVLATLKNNIKDFNNIFMHTKEMITPERANNNLRNVNYDDINNIISRSIKGLEKQI